MLDEHEDEKNLIKSPIKRYGSTRKVYLFNSKYKTISRRVESEESSSCLLTSSLLVNAMIIRVETIWRRFALFGAGCTCSLPSHLNVRNAFSRSEQTNSTLG